MWIKLARNRFWIAFCVVATVVMLLRDIRQKYSPEGRSLVNFAAQQQAVPEPVMRMRSPEPIYAEDGSATFPNGSRVTLTNKGKSRSTFGGKPTRTLAVHHDVTREIPIATRLRPDTGNCTEGSLPSVETSPKGSVISGEYQFEISGTKPTMSYAAAWLSEAQTVAEYDVASRKWLASGIRADLIVENDSENGSPEDVHIRLTLPEDMRLALYEKERAYAVIIVDKSNRVHKSWRDSLDVMDNSHYSSEQIKLEARFDGIGVTDVKTVRFVAAPFHWVYFREPMSAADKKLQARGIYPIPKALREPLRRMTANDGSSSDAGIAHDTVIVEATKFLPIASARAVRDAVIVAVGRPGSDPKVTDAATFTMLLPSYLASHNILVHAYDAAGNTNTHSSSSDPIKGPETEFSICKTYTFDQFKQSEVKRIVISVW
ncbi:MAG: hypothetical protein H8F28_02300 [Fibrella sp.]|nr:hypothetical protein [Armatimonadota bacterium]